MSSFSKAMTGRYGSGSAQTPATTTRPLVAVAATHLALEKPRLPHAVDNDVETLAELIG